MAVADRHGLPVAVCVESATPHEVKLATSTLLQMIVPEAPQNLIADNADDSDKLDAELRQYGIELIAPHRINRRNTTQDLRRLRRYRRRWKVERLFAWLLALHDSYATLHPSDEQPGSAPHLPDCRPTASRSREGRR
jgi:transposase